jgi:hypothetical protein
MKRLVLSLAALLMTGIAVLEAQPPVPRRDPNQPPPNPNPNPVVNPPNSPPQTPAATDPLQPSARPSGSMQARRMKQVLGSRITIAGGAAIGTVDDIVFSDDGCIDYLIVLNEGRYVTVPWQAAKFDFQQRTATINITQDRYREIPVFTSTQWPNFYEPSYMTRVYGYYGIPLPERHRVIDRRR